MNNLVCLSINFQFVQPAYTTMLEHIRSKAYKEFEARLTEALAKGEALVAAVETLTRASITEFDQGRAGNFHLSKQ